MKKLSRKIDGEFLIDESTYSVKRYEQNILNDGGESSLRKKFKQSSVLYVIAALSECTWFYLLYMYQDSLVRWVKELPLLGWIYVSIFTGMLVVVPILGIIGIVMFRLVQKSHSFIVTPYQKKSRQNVNLLLIVGILADLYFPAMLMGAEDRSAVILFTVMFGGRILMANILAIQIAFSVQKTVR